MIPLPDSAAPRPVKSASPGAHPARHPARRRPAVSRACDRRDRCLPAEVGHFPPRLTVRREPRYLKVERNGGCDPTSVIFTSQGKASTGMGKDHEKETDAIAKMAAKPDDGAGDCYDRVTDTCNRKHPGKNWGDKEYRDCITDGLDWCDINEPTSLTRFPVFDAEGRLKVSATGPADDSTDQSAPDDERAY